MADAAIDTTADVPATETPETPVVTKADVQAERNQRKAQKRIDWRTWRPSENTAVLNESVVLGHPVLRRLFDLAFVRGQIATYMMQSKISRSAEEEEARQRVDEVIEMSLQEVERELKAERARLLEFAKGDGIAEFPAKSYVVMEEITVPKYSPGAARLLRIFRGLDDIFWMLEVLFINGTIKLSHKMNVINRWKKILWDLVRKQTAAWVHMRDAMRDGGRIKRNRGDAPANESGGDPLSDAA